jgi:hypothetical protein
LPSMLTCALTLYSVIGCVWFWSCCTMVARVIWSRWLLCSVGCLIYVLSRYNTFRLSVNMYAGSFGYSVLMVLSVLCIAIIYARNMFGVHVVFCIC